ncbi:MAG TPA: hypothetical protein V6D05_01730 [Stenomitos sp.]
MLGKNLLALGLAGTLLVGLSGAANAEMRPSTSTMAVPVVNPSQAGPTRLYSVPRADVLGTGTNLMSVSLGIGSIGIGPAPVGIGIASVSGNALNLRADMGMSPGFELGTGIGVIATAPWRGRLDMSGKWAWLNEGAAIASVAGLAGGVLEIDANGTPSLGLQVGLPVSKLFPFGVGQLVGLSVVPTWNLGLLSAGSAVGATGPFNFFGLGLGADLMLVPNLHLLADTNLGFPIAGINTQSALGVRYEFSRDLTGDLFVGFASGQNLGLGGGVRSLGIGSTWRY